MGLKIACPNCGTRDATEFAFGGELRPMQASDPRDDFARVYHRDNAPGSQTERWYHAFGCRRWLTLSRDTVTNVMDEVR